MKEPSVILKNIIIGVIPSLVAMALYFVIQSVFGEQLSRAQQALIVGLVVLVVLTPVTIFISNFIQKKIKEKITPDIIEKIKPSIKEDFYEDLQAKTGIIEIFPNYPACDGEIVEHLKISKNIKLFLQIGKTVLAGTTSIYDYLANIELERGTSIKILHTNTDSPWLSEDIANARDSNYDDWFVDTKHAEMKTHIIESHRSDDENNITFESKIHNEGYIWRLFIFDDLVYAQPYLYKSNNSEQAPVYKISKYFTSSKDKSINNNSLYTVFSKFFDTKWESSIVNEIKLDDRTHREVVDKTFHSGISDEN